MKTRLALIITLFLTGALSIACHDEDNGGNNAPAPKTLEAFAEDFPDAQNVSWERKKGYDVAYFTLPAARAAAAGQNSAWYSTGSDRCTYAKIEITWEQLQQEAPAVAAAWEASSYKKEGYILDDIDRKSYASGDAPTYKLEAELRGSEYELVYKHDGTLISERLDADDTDERDEDDPAPLEVLDLIALNLPGAVVLESETDIDHGRTTYEVEIAYLRGQSRIEAELYFDAQYALLFAAQEIDERDYTAVLPSAVQAKFRELAAGNEMEDVAKIHTSFADFKADTDARYMMTVEIEDADREQEITYVVDAAGNLLEQYAA